MIEIREKEGWKYEYEEFLDCGPAHFQGAKIENGKACFSYHLEVTEFDSKVNAKDGKECDSEIMKTKGLMNCTYRIMISLHPEPDIETTGHYWEISEFYKIGESTMLM